MIAATVNNVPITQARITLRAAGAWDAQLSVSTLDVSAVSGPATIVLEGTELKGYASVAGADAGGDVTLRVIGGAGGLDVIAPAVQYGQPTTVRTVITDALRAGGEELSTESSQSVAEQVPQWTRVEGTVADALWMVCERRGLTWAVGLDGLVWVGVHEWAEETFEGVPVVDGEEPSNRVVMLAPDALVARPGVTYAGQRVTTVTYWLTGNELRCELRMGEQRGQMEELLGRVVASEVAHLDYHGRYLAKAVGQNGDGSLELRPYDPKWPPMSRVKIRRGVPGLSELTIAPTVDVAFTHEDGFPDCPVVVSFGEDPIRSAVWKVLETLKLGGDDAREVAMADLTKAALDAIVNAFNAHTHSGGTISGATGPPAAPVAISDIKSIVVLAK